MCFFGREARAWEKRSCAGLIENVDFNFKSPLPTWSITALERRMKNAENVNKNKNKKVTAKGKATTTT